MGNNLVSLNRLIFFCEIIGCKNIILDQNKFWYIKNKIFLPKYNLTISVEQNIYNKSSDFYFDTIAFYYSIFNIKPEIRIHLLRNEIIKNLFHIQTSKNNLYIHLRGGDIFIDKPNRFYAQPPLCFYEAILTQYNFSKIYIISEDKKNPVFSKLINKYSNIIYTKNSLKLDISFLINAYNIVASVSSFVTTIIQLNYNVKFIWDYNIYQIQEKILHFHYDLFNYPNNKFVVFRMKPSFNYIKNMVLWKNNKKQKKLMIKEKCNNYFSIIFR